MYSIAKGPWVFYQVAGGREKGLPSLVDWGADGAIVRESGHIENVLSFNIPTVVSVDQSRKVAADIILSTDQADIARLAAEHFLERNYENFAFSGHRRLWWAQERADQFRKAVAVAGFKTDIFVHSEPAGKLTWGKAQTRMIEWLKSLPKPVALMAANDYHCQYIIESCKIAELNIPGDVALLGVDNDTMICEFTLPSFSSINLDTKCAGYKAAELLDQLMQGEKCHEREILVKATHVVTRASTDMMAIEDQLVVRALGYMQRNYRELIQVSDVADAVAISRSALDRRFHKALGSSVQKEMRRIRVVQVAKMLIETDLTITQIALAMNFTGIEHLGRYFKREKGLSPLEYRKRYRLV